MYTPISQLPAHARVWVYLAERPLSASEETWVQEKLQAFCQGWEAHRQPLQASFEIKAHQVIILAVDEAQAAASGCSIDKSLHLLAELESHLGLRLTDRGLTGVWRGEHYDTYPFAQVKQAVAQGLIGADDLLLILDQSHLGALPEGLHRPAGSTWLAKYFSAVRL